MKLENGYWIDKNNNRWSVGTHTKEQAEKESSTLINCRGCYNCNNCNSCFNCGHCYDSNDCINCYACDRCNDCYDCHHCYRCSHCNLCYDCRNCYNCKFCNFCGNCNECENCNDCKDYVYNPKKYVTGRIGSREDQTVFYYGELDGGQTEIQVACGCFTGNLEEFEARVEKVHGDNKYGRQYMAEIAKVRMLWEE